MEKMTISDGSAIVFNIQRFCLHDGPGIRTTVFMKGCSLRCLWCSNPESINPSPQLGVARARCNSCGDCVSACPEGAIVLDENGKPRIDRRLCKACGSCVKVCFEEALTVYGENRKVEDVFQEVMKDKGWYAPEGGVTVSGGEPLLHSSFVTRLFNRCKEEGISTCIETSGNVAPEVLLKVLEFTDVVLYDLKHMNSREYEKLTGHPNRLVLDNARIVVDSGVKVQFRLPLVPGLNSDSDNIQATSKLLLKLMRKKASIELMPYHSLGKGKYEALDCDYPLKELPMAETEFVKSVQKAFEEEGVACLVLQRQKH